MVEVPLRSLDHAELTGINDVVEKIEHEADVIELLDLPVELGQGFRFGEPRLARDAA